MFPLTTDMFPIMEGWANGAAIAGARTVPSWPQTKLFALLALSLA